MVTCTEKYEANHVGLSPATTIVAVAQSGRATGKPLKTVSSKEVAPRTLARGEAKTVVRSCSFRRSNPGRHTKSSPVSA